MSSYRSLFLASALLAVAMLSGVLAAYLGLGPISVPQKASIYFTLLGCGILVSFYAGRFVLGFLSAPQRQFWLLSTIGFVCAFTLSLSWPIFEAMVIPGLGFLIAVYLETSSARMRAACYFACAFLVFSGAVWKLDRPFGFEDWYEPPVRDATLRSTLPQLRGFRLPESEVRMLEGAAHIIRAHSTASDTIFTYPVMPIFHAISNRWWPAYAADHNVDACPDDIARQDAIRILQARPAVLIYYREDPAFLDVQEMFWRHGKRSGQRDLIAAVESLAKEYKLAADYPAPPTKLHVEIYVRQ